MYVNIFQGVIQVIKSQIVVLFTVQNTGHFMLEEDEKREVERSVKTDIITVETPAGGKPFKAVV